MSTSRQGRNLVAPPADRVCGAKTRDGPPCPNWGMWPSGRCRMHGGKSPTGFASATHKHGWYSTHLPTRLAAAFRARRDAEAGSNGP